MKKIITEYYCDICGNQTNNLEKEVPIIFLTEQNEGRPTNPYFDKNKIVLCDLCKKKVFFEGKQIFANGAMGCNEYYFLEKSDK